MAGFCWIFSHSFSMCFQIILSSFVKQYSIWKKKTHFHNNYENN